MVTYSERFHEELRREIRDLRAVDPLVTYAALARKLGERHNHTFDQRYIKKLCDKVTREAIVQADRTQIEERLHPAREKFRIASEAFLRIIYWKPETAQKGIKPPLPMDIIEAAKSLAMLELALLKAEINNGLYKKPLDQLAREIHYEPLPPEVRAVIVASWRRGGLLPAATVGEMMPEQRSPIGESSAQ